MDQGLSGDDAHVSAFQLRGSAEGTLVSLFTTAQGQELYRLRRRWLQEQAEESDRQHRRGMFARYLVQRGRLHG